MTDDGSGGGPRPVNQPHEVPLESPQVPGDGFESFEALFHYLRLRKASSKRRGCPWLAKAVRRKLLGDRWYFEVRNDHHNHKPSLHPSAHPVHRKRTWTEEQKQEIRQVFKTTTLDPAMSPRSCVKGTPDFPLRKPSLR
ncbi:hypothetical protein B0I37DRAFT_352065 [Chaetomium sp. MPI-CAGE-AT-0009]|nr:hypothetical protein B0I37DRAFT_352065 [Chaetomium sp. MPI-CAGE-AT-0009]